jgi:hypothetical protein
VTIIGLSLSSCNAFGYWKGDKTIAGGIRQQATDFITQNLVLSAHGKAVEFVRG